MADNMLAFRDNTVQYYEDHAEEFSVDTINADMQDIRGRFLSYLTAGSHILDFGCGTGRDSKAFHELGYEVSALDGLRTLLLKASVSFWECSLNS